jgi:hypothetical protein
MDVVDTLKSGEHSHGIAVAILTIATTNSWKLSSFINLGSKMHTGGEHVFSRGPFRASVLVAQPKLHS